MPLVVTERTANALRLTAVDAKAAKLGLFPGMALTDARARVERLDVATAAPERDAALLASCPLVRTLHAAYSLRRAAWVDARHHWLRTSFGGLAAMREDAIMRIERAGLNIQAAMADNSFAARLLARGTRGGVFSKAGVDHFYHACRSALLN